MPRGSGPVLSSPRGTLSTAIILEGALAPVAVAVGWVVGVSPFQTVAISWPALGVAAAATVPPLLFLHGLLRTEWVPLVRLRETADRLLGEWIGAAGWPALVLLAILAGVGEEAVFRGLLQHGVASRAGVIAGWLVAGVLFGLLHFLTPLYAFLATGAGLYLGAAYLVTSNLFVPIAIHAAYDAAALLALARRARVSGQDRQPPPVAGG